MTTGAAATITADFDRYVIKMIEHGMEPMTFDHWDRVRREDEAAAREAQTSIHPGWR